MAQMVGDSAEEQVVVGGEGFGAGVDDVESETKAKE